MILTARIYNQVNYTSESLNDLPKTTQLEYGDLV